jgi:hypothetical protein
MGIILQILEKWEILENIVEPLEFMVAKFLWSSWVPLTPEFILYSLSYKYTKS